MREKLKLSTLLLSVTALTGLFFSQLVSEPLIVRAENSQAESHKAKNENKPNQERKKRKAQVKFKSQIKLEQVLSEMRAKDVKIE